MAMTAHAVYLDHSKTAVTVSKKAMTDLIRNKIGFDGLVMSDDLDMKALSGRLADKTEKALNAGCDIALQCSGQLEDMLEVAKGARALEGRSVERAAIATECAKDISEFDRADAEVEFNNLMQRVS